MEKRDFKHIIKKTVSTQNFTSGIHNYCDRWCERCTHTSKCSVFKIEQQMNLSNEELDIQNEQFWNSLSNIFRATVEMLHEKMEELGIEIDPKEINSIEKEKNPITEPLSSEMVVITREYAMEVAKWLEKNRSLILEKFELHQNINENNALIIADAVDVIQHYFMLIATKTYRASLVFNDVDDETDDARGSAKVTLIIIDRSIAAWSTMLSLFPSLEDDILKHLRILSKVKRLLLAKFPTAMEFKRPGFDE